MDFKLKRKEFKAWLKSRPPEWTAETCNDCSCPLALYLTDVFGDKTRVTARHFYRVDTRFTALPHWAVEFVRSVDTINDGVPGGAVRATEVLEALKKTKKK